MSGIKAADILFTSGTNNFLVLEATDRIGGRVYNQHFGGTSVELGANWVHGHHRVSNAQLQHFLQPLLDSTNLAGHRWDYSSLYVLAGNGQYVNASRWTNLLHLVDDVLISCENCGWPTTNLKL